MFTYSNCGRVEHIAWFAPVGGCSKPQNIGGILLKNWWCFLYGEHWNNCSTCGATKPHCSTCCAKNKISIVSGITYDIIPDIISDIMPDISYIFICAGLCVSCRTIPFSERTIGWIPDSRQLHPADGRSHAVRAVSYGVAFSLRLSCRERTWACASDSVLHGWEHQQYHPSQVQQAWKLEVYLGVVQTLFHGPVDLFCFGFVSQNCWDVGTP